VFKLSGKVLAWIAVGLVALLAGGLFLVYGVGTFKKETADFRGGVSATEQIQADGKYRIAKYNWFFDQCAAVQTTEAQLEAAEAELAITDPGSWRAGQIRANITAVTSARAELINEYNAESAKTDTAANFKASELPYELDIDTKETQCVP
jgi:hypothetical protein